MNVELTNKVELINHDQPTALQVHGNIGTREVALKWRRFTPIVISGDQPKYDQEYKSALKRGSISAELVQERQQAVALKVRANLEQNKTLLLNEKKQSLGLPAWPLVQHSPSPVSNIPEGGPHAQLIPRASLPQQVAVSSAPPNTLNHWIFERHQPYARSPEQQHRRKSLPRQATTVFKDWLSANIKNPFPSTTKIEAWARAFNLSNMQVNTWFERNRRKINMEAKKEKESDVIFLGATRPSQSLSASSALPHNDHNHDEGAVATQLPFLTGGSASSRNTRVE